MKKIKKNHHFIDFNREKIILFTAVIFEIKAGDNITIIVKQQNITVNDTVYLQYYIVDNNSLKKEGEQVYLSIYAISCCFAIFLALPFFSSVILYFIIDLIVLIIIKISEIIKLYRLTRRF